jgi:hypothetical protein
MIFSLLLTAAALADVTLSRTVTKVAPGDSAYLTLSKGCKSADAYGSNDCELAWGDSAMANITATFTQTLTNASKLQLNLKAGILPVKATCDICGADCEFTIVGVPVKFSLPPCPITAGTYSTIQNVSLPDKSPIAPISIKATGTVDVTDDTGAIIASLNIDVDVKPK